MILRQEEKTKVGFFTAKRVATPEEQQLIVELSNDIGMGGHVAIRRADLPVADYPGGAPEHFDFVFGDNIPAEYDAIPRWGDEVPEADTVEGGQGSGFSA